MRMIVSPGYTTTGIVVDNGQSQTSEYYDTRLKVRIYELHGPGEAVAGKFKGLPSRFVKFLCKDDDLPWIRIKGSELMNLSYKYEAYPAGTIVYVTFPSGSLNSAMITGVLPVAKSSEEGFTYSSSVGDSVVGGASGTVSGNYGFASGFVVPSPGCGSPYKSQPFISGKHKGVDITCSGASLTSNPQKPLIYSAKSGVVVEIETNWKSASYSTRTWGNRVRVSHGTINGKQIYTHYCHLSEVNVKVGQQVVGASDHDHATLLGRMGNTGTVLPAPTNSNPDNGHHLHFEVWESNSSNDRVNPEKYLSIP